MTTLTDQITRESVEQKLLDAIHAALDIGTPDEVRTRVLAYREFRSDIHPTSG